MKTVVGCSYLFIFCKDCAAAMHLAGWFWLLFGCEKTPTQHGTEKEDNKRGHGRCSFSKQEMCIGKIDVTKHASLMWFLLLRFAA
jgi:hypothetical protein